MPKMKTHRSAHKRFKRTGTGKFTCRRAGRSHLNVTFSSGRKRRLDGTHTIDESNEKRIAIQLPYKQHTR
jgi:large subunit ribosomal protein L35